MWAVALDWWLFFDDVWSAIVGLWSFVTDDLWSFVTENRSELLAGLRRTLMVSAIAIVGASLIGLILGAARAHRIPVVRQLAGIYVELIRNTPILVQIFMLYFGLGSLGTKELGLFGAHVTVDFQLDAFTVAWVSVMVWGGAFNTENFRAGFEAVPYRYREAGSALGFGPIATFLNITLPIGGRIALPSSINTYISVLKNTSLLYVIGYPELTTTAYQIQGLTIQTAEAYTVLGIMYLIIVWTLSALIRLLESHLALPEERR